MIRPQMPSRAWGPTDRMGIGGRSGKEYLSVDNGVPEEATAINASMMTTGGAVVATAVTQEEWDGTANLSVKLMDSAGVVTGAAFDATVRLNGGTSRPYVASGDYVPMAYIGGAWCVVLQASPDPLGAYKDAYVAPGDIGSGAWKWWRAADGSVCDADGLANSLDGETLPDARGQVRFGYKSTDTDFDGLVGGKAYETGGGKTHTHNNHRLPEMDNPLYGTSTDADGGETVTSAATQVTVSGSGTNTSDIGLTGTTDGASGDSVDVDYGTDTSVPGDHTHGLSAAYVANGDISIDITATESSPGHTHDVTTSDHSHGFSAAATTQSWPTPSSGGNVDGPSGDLVLTHDTQDHKNPYYTAVVAIKVA